MLATTDGSHAQKQELRTLLSQCANLSFQDARDKVIAFFTEHYDLRQSKNWPAFFSALTQVISMFGGRTIETMAIQNLILAAFASTASFIEGQNHHAQHRRSTHPYRGTDASIRSDSLPNLLNSVDYAARSTVQSFTSSSLTSAQHLKENLKKVLWNVLIERLVDLCLFAIAAGYKLAGGPTPLSAASTNAFVWETLSVNQQGTAQALSYIMYRNYAWALTVLCTMFSQIIDLMNHQSNPSMKLVAYAAALGMVMAIGMLMVNNIEHTIVTQFKAEKPNQVATPEQRQEQKSAFDAALNSYERLGSFSGEPGACQSSRSANKDFFSGHVSNVAILAYSSYRLSKAILNKYPDNLYVKALCHLMFAAGCAFAAETAATRVLGDCHTFESVMIAPTQFLPAAIMAKFFTESLDLAINNPARFVREVQAVFCPSSLPRMSSMRSGGSSLTLSRFSPALTSEGKQGDESANATRDSNETTIRSPVAPGCQAGGDESRV